MHAQRVFMAIALRIDVQMQLLARQLAVEQLNATDLDHPVALVGEQAGGLGVQKYLAHG